MVVARWCGGPVTHLDIDLLRQLWGHLMQPIENLTRHKQVLQVVDLTGFRGPTLPKKIPIMGVGRWGGKLEGTWDRVRQGAGWVT